jgi:voltage-gated potassium channel
MGIGMTTPLDRVRRGLIILSAIFLLSVTGYLLAGYPLIEAVWMVVITIASVGFGERSQTSPAVQLLTILVIVFGLTAAAYTFGGLLQLLLAGELEQLLGRTRMTRDINLLRNHTIVVGFGRIGRILAADLHRQQRPFVVVECDAERCREAHERGYLYINGDATDDDILASAGVASASSLVSALPNDANNVFITLTARNLNPHLKIIARAEHSTSERKLLQAGANRIIMPSTIGAQLIGRIITRPHTADLLELFAEQGNLEIEIDELNLPAGHELVGKTIGEIAAHREFGVLVLAVRRASGEMAVVAGADHRLAANDVLIVFAKPDNIAQFRKHHQL